MKLFSKRINIDAYKALIDYSHHTIFLFLWVKLVQVGYTRNVSFESITNLYWKCFGFFPFKNSPDVAWHYFRKLLTERISCGMISVYPCLDVMFFKFWFIHKTFFGQVLFQQYTLPGKTSPEKSDDTKWRKFYVILFFYFGT